MLKSTNEKGLMPLWATAIFGFLFLILGAYVAVSFYASAIGLWGGIIMVIIGLGMLFIASVLR